MLRFASLQLKKQTKSISGKYLHKVRRYAYFCFIAVTRKSSRDNCYQLMQQTKNLSVNDVYENSNSNSQLSTWI